jgi:hypothetical protein
MGDIGYIVVGAPICRAGAYIIDKFLENQREIQSNYPSSELILATEQQDFIEELKGMLKRWSVRGDVLLFEVVKPDFAHAVCWNVACAREAIRQYTLSKPEASHFLSIDADMTYDSNVINIMLKELGNHDTVASGYPGSRCGIQTGGLGCTLLTRDALKRITFRCYEFKSHQAIDEGEVFVMDAFGARLKSRDGFLLTIDHYDTNGSAKHIEPHSVSVMRRISNFRALKYILTKASIMLKSNITKRLHIWLSRLFKQW